jgi:hypothetical protein
MGDMTRQIYPLTTLREGANFLLNTQALGGRDEIRHVQLTVCAIAYEAQQVRVLQAAHQVHFDAELLLVLESNKVNLYMSSDA